jgi:hypothetical protein
MAKARPRSEPTFESISLQVAAAFGQGAGTTPVRGDAIVSAIDAYRSELQEHTGEWNTIAPAVLSWAGAVGRLSAWAAASEGRAAIESGDVTWAVGRARSLPSIDDVMLRCPLTARAARR